MYINYEEMGEFIRKQREFRGNSVRSTKSLVGNYEVSSYGTCILEMNGESVKMFDNRDYSVTTSRIQNIIARLFDFPTKRDGKVYPV